MKKALLLITSVSVMILAGCQKNGVAPSQNGSTAKKSILNQSLNKKDTIMIGSKATPSAAPSSAPRDTIMVSGK